ncbi:MAG: single-stranded-DNA-specific exonuclease RecJ [Planctomycetota bacterium]|nr:single-stranded-DNA-specific exonuclease RecJ [Planctomycetota bacterium]
MPLRWTVQQHDMAAIESLQSTCNVSPVLAQLLAVRGITHPDQVRQFLDLKMTGLRPPNELPGVPGAVDLILKAIDRKNKITIYGDYDADGMTSTAILYHCLKLLDCPVNYYVPNRLDDGYGLNANALEKLKQRGTELVITVDCGIASINDVQRAKDLGLQIIVTDHHHIGEQLPAADAIVHPALPGADYPFEGLCGAGVAFKLAWALCQRHCGSEKLPERYRNFLFRAISLAAVGTIADVVPLLDENRILVHHGLNCLRQFANPGLTHLMKLCKLTDKPKLGAEDVAFSIGPRLNAAGRLGQAQLGVELLTLDSEERGQALADYIDQLNKSRDSLDRKIARAANKMIEEQFDPSNEAALVLAQADWHLGVIGIVAGRIAEKYHRPTILISIDKLNEKPAVGSARTSCGVDLYEAISHCSEMLVKFGGHRAAAGLSIEPDMIDTFRAAFCEQVAQQVAVENLIPELDIDAEAPLSQLSLETVNDLEKLAPFGQDNPRPLLCATQVRLAADPKTMGADNRHLALQLEQHQVRMRGVGFGKSDWIEHLTDGTEYFDFAFKPVINEFRGRRNVELHLVDYRQSQPAPMPAP